ncbi:MAG TPA: TIGR02757 family protein [Nitrospiria bacterium]
MRKNVDQIKEIMERFYHNHDRRESIDQDPIQFPHRYIYPEDIEIAGLVASSFAFGRVTLILPMVQKILDRMEGTPYEFILNFDPKKDTRRFQGLYYRVWSSQDIICLMYGIHCILKKHKTLGRFFQHCYQNRREKMHEALSLFVEEVLKIDPSPIYGKNSHPPSFIHLLPSPKRGSACKRLNLFLRWMVRSGDGVDFGLWNHIPSSKLVIPLDAHIIRISRFLGFHKRRTPDWKMAVEITNTLRRFDPNDPVKYDFALCHLGISNQCPLQPHFLKCLKCELQTICSRFKRRNRAKGLKAQQLN